MHARLLALPLLLVVGLTACGSSPETTPTAAVAPEVTTTSTTDTTTLAPTTTSTAPPTTLRPTTTVRVTTTLRSAPAVTTAAPTPASGCHPSYSGCVPIASDVDCAGGSGNGPAYTSARNIRVTGPDDYGLDNDGDGLGCES